VSTEKECIRNVRCAQMVQTLRKGFLYSEKRARDFLFAAIERLLKSGPPVLLLRLTRTAADVARIEAEAAGFEFSNWNVASRAVANAMLHAEVLVTPSGNTVKTGLSGQATPIGSLRPDYIDRTEAYMIWYLIGELGDVCQHDHKALAHALFRQFDSRVPMQDFEERTVILIASMADVISLDSKGRYSLTSAPALEEHVLVPLPSAS
jgi:hypothetical protein